MKNIIKENRVGKFYVSNNFIRNEPELVKGILSRVLITRAEGIFDRDAIEYTGYSNRFDKICMGQSPPEYKVIVNQLDDNIQGVCFEKVK